MSLALYASAAILFAILFVPWVMLLSTSLVAGASIWSSLPVVATKRARDRLRPPTREEKETRKDVLVVEGLQEDSQLEDRVQKALAKVLTFPPKDSRPKACACIKKKDDEYVAVVRVFSKKGHYLLHEKGKTKAKLGRRVLEELHAFDERFPARLAANRETCPDCDPRNCPLKKRQPDPHAA